MLTLRDVRVWDTDEVIDVVVDAPEAGRTLIEADSVIEGDVDASGLTLAPGLADPHVHFRDLEQCDKETMLTGSQAAAAGGYTDVLVMPNTRPKADARRLRPDESCALGDERCAREGSAADEHEGVQTNAADSAEKGEGRQSDALSRPWNDLEVTSVLDYLDRYESLRGVRLPVDYALSICASSGMGPHAVSAHEIAGFASLRHRLAAITDDGAAIAPQMLDDVLSTAKHVGLPVLEHCEHHDSGVMNEGTVNRELGVEGIPASTELDIVERDIEAVRHNLVHLHFQHVSTAGAFEAVRRAKAEGLPVTCETAPHYLALCDEDVRRYGAMAKMNPPLRSQADMEAAVRAVADGTVDMIATDHAPHTAAQKAAGLIDAPNGIVGLETAYGVCHKVLVDAGVITERRLVELMSVAPMRLMGGHECDIDELLGRTTGVPTCKRTLDLRIARRRQRANLTVIDTNAEWTVDAGSFHSKARNTPFGGWRLTGRPLATILDGKLCMSRLPVARIRSGTVEVR
ncbi:dihydroorotase [Bifidobacterium bombi]|uniref:Dihydroorotase n=1 Tax=Bifidobacterium bombi DSM 19703 TaxID=1341695 RepID=A0A080N200_9BIFI|nr:dihydroorotase [Bifidobacterium bombi]KFF30927.1 dihydroorotase [Bifidobacterium bombi DSM 19703]